jgi:Zn ribbon nucleic-acid-binding protein
MKCPNCKNKTHIELDLHSDGYVSDLRECGECGCVWGWDNNKNIRKIVKDGEKVV